MEIKYSKILVAIDGSKDADLAFKHAFYLAKNCGAQLLLAHCYGDIPSVIGGEARAEVIKECEDEAHIVLAPYEAACSAADVTYKLFIRQGRPGRTLVQIGGDEHCDLIVMGSRGLSEFQEIVVGSVSQRVLRHAHSPVLIIR